MRMSMELNKTETGKGQDQRTIAARLHLQFKSHRLITPIVRTYYLSLHSKSESISISLRRNSTNTFTRFHLRTGTDPNFMRYTIFDVTDGT